MTLAAFCSPIVTINYLLLFKMKSFFRFSAGEWAASMLIGALIIAGILFFFLYENSAAPHEDFSRYRKQFIAFEAEQQRLADSVAAARQRQKQARLTRQDSRFNRLTAFDKDSLKRTSRQRQYQIVKVELNEADTNDIMTVPQFGSKRAQKIVEYRNKLGGFYSLEQLREIYILQNLNIEYAEEYFRIDVEKIKKININQCDYKGLIAHPYFDSYLVKCILNHRKKHGAIKDMAELRDITHIYAELEEKLKWYVEF